MERMEIRCVVQLGALKAEVQLPGMEGPEPVLARRDDDTLSWLGM
jgi:hypothetical protein